MSDEDLDLQKAIAIGGPIDEYDRLEARVLELFPDLTPTEFVGVMAEIVKDMVAALEAALPDLHILDSRLQDETERAGEEYKGLPSLRLVEAALEKVGEK